MTSTFAIRAFTERVVNGVEVIDRLDDRTFSLTVTGQDPPVFVTPAGNVGTFYDGTPIDPIQIVISENDPGDTVVVSVAAGELPPGLSINARGLITGYIIPINAVDLKGGFDRTEPNVLAWDQYPFDFVINGLSRSL